MGHTRAVHVLWVNCVYLCIYVGIQWVVLLFVILYIQVVKQLHRQSVYVIQQQKHKRVIFFQFLYIFFGACMYIYRHPQKQTNADKYIRQCLNRRYVYRFLIIYIIAISMDTDPNNSFKKIHTVMGDSVEKRIITTYPSYIATQNSNPVPQKEKNCT